MSARFRALLVAALVVVLSLTAAAIVAAVSQSDVAYRDGFQDLSGLDASRTHDVAIDALGGLRLVTNGAGTTASWTTSADFTTPPDPLGPVIGYSTLDAATTADSLQLLSSPLAFRRTSDDPVLTASDSLSTDGFSVGGMCVQRVGDTYYMWYTGVPEDGYAQRIYLATSTDGLTWTKEEAPVLDLGEPGAFDSRQLGKPSVIYDPANVGAPFRMWYAGEGDEGGSIGYATSLDGRTWVKQGEVLAPGHIGTADGYRVMHPCVLISSGVYYMWYTADDSNNKRVAYATSADGVTWQRGGVVFDVGTGNYSEGAFAPAVVKTADGFVMLFTGNKIVAGGSIQSSLIYASSSDGLDWAAGNIAFKASGGSTAFDGFNVSQPTILSDPADTTHPYKLWYVGNNPDANGNYHDRVGLAYQKSTGSLSGWTKISGSAGSPCYESFLTLGEQSTAFDSMKVADLRPVAKPASAGSGLYGFYTGTNAADFVQRIGVAQSGDDGVTWTAVGGVGTLIGAGPAGTFDAGGVACPAPLAIAGDGGWYVYHTSYDASGVASIGLHTVSADLATVTRAAAAVVTAGSGFDAGGQADPCAYGSGAEIGVFYAGRDAGGTWSIGRASSATGVATALGAGQQVLTPTAGGYDAGGLRHPVACRLADGNWRLYYTAIDADGVQRIALATASTLTGPWSKQGLVMTESDQAYDFAEAGVEPAGVLPSDGSDETLFFTGTDRFGWTRVGRAAASGAGYLDAGAATYELDNPTARDWRRIIWTPSDLPASAGREVWVSYYPTYSGLWSKPFRVDNDTDLPFLLTVERLRWQVRMMSDDAAVTPHLDDLTVTHAPVQFPAAGVATTQTIGPPEGLYLMSWGDLTVVCDQPGSTGVTAEVQDDSGAQLVAPTAVTGGTLTVPLASLPATSGRLVVVLTLTGDTLTTPTVKSLTVTYTSTDTPSQLTLTSDKSLLTIGGSATLGGVLSSDPTPLDTTDGNTTLLGQQEVVIKARTLGGTSYAEVGRATTGADGSFALPVTPTASTSYRAEWAGGTVGTVTYPPASAATTVQVKPKVALSMTRYSSRSGKYYRYAYGRTVYGKGSVKPSHATLGDGATRGSVAVTVYRYRSASRTWVKVKSVTRALSATSTYTWSYKPKARGSYRVQAAFTGDVDHAAASSVFRYVKVY